MMHRRNLLALGAAAGLSRILHAAPTIPRRAPEFTILLNSGEQVLLSNYRGKITVLEILLTTCPHCQRCSSVLQQIHNEMGGDKAFSVLGAAINPNNIGEARMVIPAYVARLGLKFPVGFSPREQAYRFLQADLNAGPVYMPQLVFIDREQNIRAQYAGTDEFFLDEEKNIRAKLAELMHGGPVKTAGAGVKKR
jgi:peroxiredoxin